jgi:predicted permease
MVFDDVIQAWRRVRSRPATMVGAAAMLALGIGLTTGMFTLADALLFRPVPFRQPERLSQLYMGSDRGGRLAVATSVFRVWRESRAFESIESAARGAALIDTATGPVARSSALVTPGLSQMLDVRPVRGRVFLPDEGRAGSDDRVLFSEDVWRSAFGADPDLIGRSVLIDQRPHVVVGILPTDFRFPSWDTLVWTPINFDTPPAGRSAELPLPFVRFAATMPQADALRLATDAAHRADATTSKLRAVSTPIATRFADQYYERAIPLLVAGVALVFLVLCANVASLLLVRLTDRRREFSMCAALGASRVRLLRQAIVESAIIGGVGSVLGVAFAWLLVALARTFLPEAFLLRTLNPLNLDVRALAAASAAGMLATLAAGLLPAWIGTRVEPAESLKAGSRSGTETRAAKAFTRALIVGEIAFACTLLVGAALLVRSFINLVEADRGIDSEGVVVAWVSLPSTAFADRASRLAMTTLIGSEMRQMPGIRSAVLTYGIPPDGSAIHFGDGWQSDVPGASALNLTVESYNVDADFFSFYGIPLLRGRTFQKGDSSNEVIVGERLAAIMWPGRDPVGRSFAFSKQKLHVVGVVREIHHPSVDPRIDRPEFYHALPSEGIGGGYFSVSLRCGEVCPDGAQIRQKIMSISPAIQVHDLGPLDAVYFEQLAAPRAAAMLGFVFAMVAVIAACGGLFGVLSYSVGRRRREFGIRTALGASTSQIRRLVLRDGAFVALVGMALGSAAGWSLARSLASLQYGVTVSDPLSWSLVLGLMALITAIAVSRPANVAAAVDPVTLLRDE